MEKDSSKDNRSEVLDAALAEVEKAMARENDLTRNAVIIQENRNTNMLENLENMVWKIRTMADKLEDMLRVIKIMRVMTEMNKKGKPFSPESLISLAGLNTGGKNQKTKKEETPPYYEPEKDITPSEVNYPEYDTNDDLEEKEMDAENLLHKMLEENPDMANNPMAKLLLQMLEEKKS